MAMDPSSPLVACLAFGALTLFHILPVVIFRVVMVNKGQMQTTDVVKTRNSDETTFIGRVGCSHVNCLENLPLFTLVVVVNCLVDGAPDISRKAWWYVYARMLQIVVHWTSVSDRAVVVRFHCFMTQVFLLLSMAYETMFA